MNESTPLSPSLRERIGRLGELRTSYGDLDIPPSELEEINYLCIPEESGVTFMPVEQYVTRVLAKANNLLSQERTPDTTENPPFEQIEFTAPTSEQIGARVSATILWDRLEKLNEQLSISDYSTPYEYHADLLEQRYPDLRAIDLRFDLERLRIINEMTGTSPVEDDDDKYYGMAVCALENTNNRLDQTVFESQTYLRDLLIDERRPNDHTPLAAAEELLAYSQRIRGSLTDTQHLNRAIRELFVDSRVYDVEATDEAGNSSVENVYIEYPQLFNISKTALANILTEDGFTETATKILNSETYEQIQTIVAEAAEDNELINSLKQQLDQIKKDTSIDNRERFVQISKIKNRLKAARRTIKGLDQLINFGSVYAQYATSCLNDFDGLLMTESDTSVGINIRLDARPDKDLDANPGKVSGDCTLGRPLPFGKEPGLHNIKVYADDNYKGNIYLYKTVTNDERKLPVWHLDAIQIPIRQIDWARFPSSLIKSLEHAAQEAGISMITINNSQHIVSNYDYVSAGFVHYIDSSAPTSEYNWAEQNAIVPEGDTRLVYVKLDFQEHGAENSTLQGSRSSQVVIWQNSNAQ